MTSEMAPVFTLVCVLAILSLSKDARAIQRHCTGPIPPAEIVNAKSTPISPDDPHIVSEVKVTLYSDYNVRADIGHDMAPLPFSDDGSAIRVITTEQLGLYEFTIITSDPVNSPIILILLNFIILTEHPCNTVAVSLPYYALKVMYEEEDIVQFPVVSVMPERGYRVNKGEDITLKISVAYEDNNNTKLYPKGIQDSDNGFAPFLQWSDDNELVIDFNTQNMPPSESNSRLRYREWTNSTDDGYLTTREMTNYRFDQSLPLDGVGVRVFEIFDILGWYVGVHAFTSLQFTDESQVLPMNIGPFIFWGGTQEGFKRLGNTTLEGQKMVTVALDTKIPENKRGLSCSTVGLHRAPNVVVSRILSIDDLKNQELVNVANPGFEMGPLGLGAFKVDLQPGGEMYYICTAYTGNEDVTSTIIKIIDINNVDK